MLQSAATNHPSGTDARSQVVGATVMPTVHAALTVSLAMPPSERTDT